MSTVNLHKGCLTRVLKIYNPPLLALLATDCPDQKSCVNQNEETSESANPYKGVHREL